MDKKIADFVRERMSRKNTDKMVNEVEQKNPSLDGQISVINLTQIKSPAR